MIDIKNMGIEELESFLGGMGKEKYRSSQLFKWLYQANVEAFDEMTNLSKVFREDLKKTVFISSLDIEKAETSRDGTVKYLFTLVDGNAVESVLIPEEKRKTLCISSQVGCLLDCRFCLTGQAGMARNLTTSEIINQILTVNRTLPADKLVTNIVFMGMGEPLLNYENVIRAIGTITSEFGMNFPTRKVTLSTAGVVPQMKRLGKDTKINLAVSINATTDDVRSRIMPINRKYPIGSLIECCRTYPLPNRRKITFEYVMIDGINDTLDDARRLVGLLKGIPSMVNILPFNEYQDSDYRRPSHRKIDAFHKYLLDRNFTVITRTSRGEDISAACGQLRGNR